MVRGLLKRYDVFLWERPARQGEVLFMRAGAVYFASATLYKYTHLWLIKGTVNTLVTVTIIA